MVNTHIGFAVSDQIRHLLITEKGEEIDQGFSEANSYDFLESERLFFVKHAIRFMKR
jgi:hypothetical protein